MQFSEYVEGDIAKALLILRKQIGEKKNGCTCKTKTYCHTDFSNMPWLKVKSQLPLPDHMVHLW